MGASGQPRSRPEARWTIGASATMAVVALVLIAVTMRAPITLVGPLLADVAVDVGDLAVAALLVSLPLVSFSLAAPVFPVIMGRLGLARSLQVALGLVAMGLLLRQAPGLLALLGGTVVAGLGIAALNVALPVVVKARWPDRVGLVTGIHTSITAIAAATAAALSLPLAEQFGWRVSMASVGAVVALAAGLAVLLAGALSSRAQGGASGASRPRGVVFHRTTRWLAALMALQAGTYYALVSWLPTVLLEAGRSGVDVSALQGLFVLLGVISGPAAGLWLQDGRAPRSLALVCTVPLVGALTGLVVAPDAALLWVVLAGLGCGATFTLTLALFAVKSATAEVTAVVSSTAQTIGYVAAAVVPAVVGLIASRAGSWEVALLVLAAVALIQAVVAVCATRSAEVGSA